LFAVARIHISPRWTHQQLLPRNPSRSKEDEESEESEEVMEERPLPAAKRQKMEDDEDEGTTRQQRRQEIADWETKHFKDDPTVVLDDLIRSLPATIVANCIYPFAVKVIRNREELIEAVDEYLDEFFFSDEAYNSEENDEEDTEESSTDEAEEEEHEDGEESRSDDQEEELDASSTLSDDRTSSSTLGSSRQNDEETRDTALPAHSSRANRRRYPIGDWDVSQVDDFSSVFDVERNRKARNLHDEDLSRWNVADGTSFARMFCRCRAFRVDLSNWKTGRATNLSQMFEDCISFQSDVSRWNLSRATNLHNMFCRCNSFHSNVSAWNVARATSFSGMFMWCVPASIRTFRAGTWPRRPSLPTCSLDATFSTAMCPAGM
jgi:surface protein